ncbi:histidine phosphotransferase family protein [Thalassococcus sp. S3]|uniref:histidine phosphotransferase family protein n=1 Tax=Thalassococcus sp. S3 TaxID=2017482 RepID=UPI001024901F|nr:histidine phosphotransferase family protein [Thalassococcus sp. S3]QBF31956.1 histidine phosphotransferase [Thalassococcus sp. S3]
MGQSNVNLAALIGSRICHDLISPIGAITNGLELLDIAGVSSGPEISLISESVENAGARIRFFRIAYGAAGEQSIARSEIVALLNDLRAGSRVSVQYGPLDAQPRSDLRLAFLALQCCETALAYGGTVRILKENGTWSIIGGAEKLNVVQDVWDDLTRAEKRAEITPALVQFALLPEIAAEDGRTLDVTYSDTEVAIRF